MLRQENAMLHRQIAAFTARRSSTTRLFMSGSRVTPTAYLPGRQSWIAAESAVEHLTHVAIEAEMVPLRNNVVIPFGPRYQAPRKLADTRFVA
jgi:hypothetical protein